MAAGGSQRGRAGTLDALAGLGRGLARVLSGTGRFGCIPPYRRTFSREGWCFSAPAYYAALRDANRLFRSPGDADRLRATRYDGPVK